MQQNKRKSLRRDVRHTAWLRLEGNQLHGCVLSNVSELGARIEVEDTKLVPDSFELLLSSSGKARRACRVVWRKSKQLGVKFEGPQVARKKMAMMPVIDADGEIHFEPELA